LKTILILGIATIISFISSFELLRSLTHYQILIIIAVLSVSLLIIPFALMQFYKNPNTALLFKNSISHSDFEKKHTDFLTLILLNIFWVVVFYLMVFLQGVFPLFGKFVFKREGTYLLSMAIFLMLVLTYLYYKYEHDMKYAMLVYYIILLLTFTITFFQFSTKALINLLVLPAYELEKVLPAFWIPAGFNLGTFFGILIIIQIYLLFKNRKDSCNPV